jgi:hypothetical protein
VAARARAEAFSSSLPLLAIVAAAVETSSKPATFSASLRRRACS